jgi:hypothetical protein
MTERIRRLFNLYSGEERQAILFTLLAFLLSCGASSAWKLSDALFLIHLSADDLPKAYGAISCLLILFAAFIIKAFNTYTPTAIFRTVLICGISYFGLVSLSLFLGLEKTHPASWFILKVFSQISFIQAISTFWTYLDQYYHFQDAKRLYTLFNCAIYIGTGFAGFLIQSGSIEMVYFFFLIVCMWILSFLVMRVINKNCQTVPDDSEIESVDASDVSLKQVIKAIFRSKFTLYLMLGNLTLFLLMTTTEYSYFSIFERHFETGNVASSQAGDEASYGLTRFIGSLIAYVGLANLITGWFLYSRFVLRFGVTNLILVTPIAYLFTYVGWPFDHSLLFPIFGFIIVESLYPVIEDNNFNLLLNAVPMKLKYKVRVLIESFSEPIGMLLCSILLSISSVNNIYLGLILSIISVSIAFTIRSKYFNAIFRNLAEHALQLYKNTSEWLVHLSKKDRKNAEAKLIQYIESEDPDFQALACEGIVESQNLTLLKRALEKKGSLSKKAIMKLLSLLEVSPYAQDTYIINALYRLQENSQDPEVYAAIDFYCAKKGFLHPEKAQIHLTSPYLLQRGASIIALQHSYAHQLPQDVAANKAYAHEEIQYLLSSTHEDELCLGITLLGVEGSSQNIEILIDYLKHPSLAVAESAASALQECLDLHSMRHAQTILEQIELRSDLEFRLACLKALSKIGHTSLVRSIISISAQLLPQEARLAEKIVRSLGLKIIPSLVGIMQDTTMSDRSRIIASKILAQLSMPQLTAHLYDVIRKELERSYFYFYYGSTLPDALDGQDIKLLKEGLLSSFQSTINFIIHLLGTSRWIDDSELLTFSLSSKSSKIRNQAIESLETCCDRRVFRLLWPLIGDLPLKEKLSYCNRFADTQYNIAQVLEKLEESPGTLDIILAATWKYRLNLPGWRVSLRRQMANQEEIFHHFAYELLES